MQVLQPFLLYLLWEIVEHSPILRSGISLPRRQIFLSQIIDLTNKHTHHWLGGAKGRDFHGLQGLGDFSIHTNISEINYITHLLDAQECSQSQLYDCSASSEHLRRATTHQISDHGISQITSTNRDIERSKSGVEYLLNTCRSHPGEISILILSPATTLATAVAAFPSLPNYVKR